MHVNRELNAYSEYCANAYSGLYEDSGQGARDADELLTESFVTRLQRTAKDASVSRFRIMMDYGVDINRMTFIEYLQMLEVLIERNAKEKIGEEE